MRTRPFLQTSFVILTLLAATAHADEIEYVVRGIDEPALTETREFTDPSEWRDAAEELGRRLLK